MKHLFIALAMFLITSLSIKAQNYTETIYLKNGSVVKGSVLEEVPNQSFTIKTIDGSIFVCEIDNVLKRTKGESNSSNIYSYNNLNYTGYKGFVDFGYSFGIGDNKIDRLELTTSHGYQFNPYLYLGVGAGLSYFQLASAVAVPFFANPRLTIPTNGSISPFVDVKVGYTVSKYVEGFYFSPSIGARFDILNNKAINLSLGYTMQRVKVDGYDYDYYSYYPYSSKFNIGAITFKAGFEF